MHHRKCHDTCRRFFGRVVRIEDYDGNIHVGKIIDITEDSVWIKPIRRPSFDTGFGYYDANSNDRCDSCRGRRCDNCGSGGYGGGYGYGYGGYELAFGFIFGIALAALFFI